MMKRNWNWGKSYQIEIGGKLKRLQNLGLRNHEFSLQIGRKRTTTEITNKPVLAVVVAVGIVRQSQCLTVALRSPCTELFSCFWQPRGDQRRRGDQLGHLTVASRKVDAVCFAIKGRENGFSTGRRVEVRGSVGGVRVWKVLRRGEKGIGVCRGGDNRRRERVVVEKRRCVTVCVWRRGEKKKSGVVLWFGGGVGGARRKGWQRRNRKKLTKTEKRIVLFVGILFAILHLFLSYGPGWPDGPTGLTGRAVKGWRAEIRGPAHTFSTGLTGWLIGPGPFCHL